MPRLKWLILDANAVIILHELGIWRTLIDRCDIHLAKTVVESEAIYFERDEAVREGSESPRRGRQGVAGGVSPRNIQ